MDLLTLATTSHVLATLVAGGVGIYALRSRGFQRPTLHLVILALGIVCGVTVVVSGFYLIEHWAALMDEFDFTERMRGNVNVKRLPDQFYFVPAYSTTFGAVATLAFISLLYRRVRGIG
jgi:hypothetical protein